jgi:cysteine desulfurase NifS/selenium donor protein
MPSETIYLDYNATTPVDPEVAEVMKPFLTGCFGNPSSSHSFGLEARKAVESARKSVASLLNCLQEEIVFTSGGTESNNFAIKGIAEKLQDKGSHIITSVIEHPAVMEVCAYLRKKGFHVTFIPVNHLGIIDLSMLRKAIRKDTILITVMHANNETGTIQPIPEIAEIAKSYNIVFHTDAAQSIGKIKVDVGDLGVDLLSLAGHKFYGPKGVGALYIRSGILPASLLHGADHEGNRRAGTENVMEIAGLGKSCEIAGRDLENNHRHLKTTRDLLFDKINVDLKNVLRNGDPENCLPNTLNISFPGTNSGLVLSSMQEIAASAGAACHSNRNVISHVLKAMGVPNDYAMSAIRFSTGKFTTTEEIERSAEIIIRTVSAISSARQEDHEKILLKGIKLTEFTHGLGCACKAGPDFLAKIIREIPHSDDPRILIDARNADDAAVYKINDETAIVQTVDFFTPVVDDPFDFGAIAASNALSDIYAMGAKPLFALNIAGFPINRLPGEILESIIKGAVSVATEAGIFILGGHTIENTEPVFGMAVTGIASPAKILSNSNARPGDVLILTKPLGTGIITTGIKKGHADDRLASDAITLMKQLNKTSSEVASAYPVNACTDITGFGLAGHLVEMITASKVSAVINYKQVPVIPGTYDLLRMGLVPGGTKRNREYYDAWINWDPHISEDWRLVLCDAQTSGGLLFSVPETSAMPFLDDLKKHSINWAAVIGNIISESPSRIIFH